VRVDLSSTPPTETASRATIQPNSEPRELTVIGQLKFV